MYPILTPAAIALALLNNALAVPLQARQEPSLVLADTFTLVAKSYGSNPNPSSLPNINNWIAQPVHVGAGRNLFVLTDPSTTDPDLAKPGLFRNGSDCCEVGHQMHITAGVAAPNEVPYSMVFATIHQVGSSNPGAQAGFVELDIGAGSSGIDLRGGRLDVTYASDFFYACPDIPVEGSRAIAVGVTNRYASPIPGCWPIVLYAQCAGDVSPENVAAFPDFRQASCYADAASAPGPTARK
ncbi:hypothetical protein LZ554_009204 [Drepanopeziza brunnea f. sp. 'monogermtubi']|nr:hypothetical protein LZ554_009204 [Drepanopeziza brunnea f. sp. 'monogermtubi']